MNLDQKNIDLGWKNNTKKNWLALYCRCINIVVVHANGSQQSAMDQWMFVLVLNLLYFLHVERGDSRHSFSGPTNINFFLFCITYRLSQEPCAIKPCILWLCCTVLVLVILLYKQYKYTTYVVDCVKIDCVLYENDYRKKQRKWHHTNI